MKLLRVWFFLLVTLGTVPASAHVVFTAPENGVTVLVGQPVSVAWVDAVVHDGVGYDLEYAGNLLAQGLPTSTHSFVWVPTAPCTCRLKVTQVNVGESYEAEIDVTVVAPGDRTTGGGGGSGGGAAGMTSGGGPSLPTAGSSSAGAGGAAAGHGGDSSDPTTSEAGVPPTSSFGGEPSSTPPANEGGLDSGEPTSEPQLTDGEGGAIAVDDAPRSPDASCAVSRSAASCSSLLLLLLAAAGLSGRRPARRLRRSRK